MMRRQFFGAFRDAASTPFRVALLFLEVLIAAAITALTLAFLLSSVADIRVASAASDSEVMTFELAYAPNVPPSPDRELLDAVSRAVESSAGFTMVLNNIDAQPRPFVPRVAIATPGFADFHGLKVAADSDKTVVIGANVQALEVGDTFSLGVSNFTVGERAAQGTAFLDSWGGAVSMDDLVLVIVPLPSVVELAGSPGATDELVGRVVLVQPSDTVVSQLLAATGPEKGMTLSPRNVADRLNGPLGGNLRDSIVYTVLFALVLGVIAIACSSTLNGITRRNLRMYAVLQLAGARQVDIAQRLAWFVTIVFLAPVAAVFALGSLVLSGFSAALPFALALALAVCTATLWSALSVVRAAPLVDQINRRE